MQGRESDDLLALSEETPASDDSKAPTFLATAVLKARAMSDSPRTSPAYDVAQITH